MDTRRLTALMLCMLIVVCAFCHERRLFNLTAADLRVDGRLPQFVYSRELPAADDSIYTAEILYPEFIEMSDADIAAYNNISGAIPPEMPPVSVSFQRDRERRLISVRFCPVVFRDNRYQMLVSFMLDVRATAKNDIKNSANIRKYNAVTGKRNAASADDVSSRYAAHSVLASGTWAKIRVASDGVYSITQDLINRAGFRDLSKIKVYGYGGHLQNETLDGNDLKNYDDLREVPQCIINGRHLFYANGSVSWQSASSTVRTRNPYSDYGYYFITESDDGPLTVDSATFLNTYYPLSSDSHSLYENDGFSWYHGGRNLFERDSIPLGRTKSVVLTPPAGASSGRIAVRVSAGSNSRVAVLCNSQQIGTATITLRSYDRGNQAQVTANVQNGAGNDTITIRPLSGGPVRLDFVSAAWSSPYPAPNLNTVSRSPEYVYRITNQDHHADEGADMIIIIPTSQKLLEQALRLAAFHESHDSLTVRIVPADELYNEFSSGTPDASAYRHYLKMLYDRAAANGSRRPRYLLLFGDGVWDNRMLTSDTRTLSPDDYLLCYESENSFNEVSCYVDDSWYGLLDDGEGGSPETELIDVAVGRFPVSTADDAKTMVDKTIAYATNSNAGDWQNTMMFMGDDGNNDLHMRDENEVADYISSIHPGYIIKKVMWDSYTREVTSTGAAYPEATRVIKNQQQSGALIMDYAGHGAERELSHEGVLWLSDFQQFTNKNLPLWITASCDVMPFDDVNATIGEASVLNKNGGSVAFYGTTRTVYAYLNKYMNRAFLRRVLSRDSTGRACTLGEAHRMAQNDLMTGSYQGESDLTSNHLQYSLLGDPALSLNLPEERLVIDSINGTAIAENEDSVRLSAGTVATISGHYTGSKELTGVVSLTVRDTKETIVCKANNPTESDSDNPFKYSDRPKTLFTGSDSIRSSRFKMSFPVPKDINYADGSGMINVFAASSTDHRLTANGSTDKFIVGGSDISGNDTIGPSIYCYLNTPSFTNGGDVNSEPFFVAEVSDTSGINASGSGIGHDMELIIDGKMNQTYNLNDNFTFDFGSYTHGTTWYGIPALPAGSHRLVFRAYDALNNSSSAELTFNVVGGLKPALANAYASPNPAKETTTFYITHDRMNGTLDVKVEVFDFSGRVLWQHEEEGTSSANVYTVPWDLTTGAGARLSTGVYLYRASIASDGSKWVSRAGKLIIW